MPIRPRPPILAGLAAAGTLVIAAAPALAQKATAAASGPSLPCSALLTDAELKAALGVVLENLGATDRGHGESECDWMARGGPGGLKTVAVSFYDASAIKESQQGTGDGFFEMVVKATEESLKITREVIPGTAVHAAFLPAEPQTLTVVHRADGVARIVGNGLTKAQAIAVAKAVATP